MKKNLGWNSHGATYTELTYEGSEMIARDIMPGKFVQSILDSNAEKRALGKRPNPKAHGKLAASIPLPIYHEWKKEWRTTYRQDWTWKTYLTMKINNRDFSFLKTNEMKL
jgi:hypothetical protein